MCRKYFLPASFYHIHRLIFRCCGKFHGSWHPPAHSHPNLPKKKRVHWKKNQYSQSYYKWYGWFQRLRRYPDICSPALPSVPWLYLPRPLQNSRIFRMPAHENMCPGSTPHTSRPHQFHWTPSVLHKYWSCRNTLYKGTTLAAPVLLPLHPSKIVPVVPGYSPHPW